MGHNKNKHWAKIGERGSYFGLRAAYWAYGIVGPWLGRFILFFVIAYFFLRSGRARQASRQFLDRVWGFEVGRRSLGHKPGLWTVYRHFMRFGLAVADKLDSWSGKIRLQDVDYHNRALFEERLAAGKGGVWVTSHLGNIEVCRALEQQGRNIPMTVLVHSAHAPKFNRLLSEINPTCQVELLQVTEFDMGVAMQLQDRISRGHFIFIVGDRTAVSGKGRVIRLPFLGREAPFPAGPFLMASMLNCPAGSLFCVREGNRFRLIFDDLPGLAARNRQEREQAVVRGAAQFAAQLQSLCLSYPLQWFNFFDFWHQPGIDNGARRKRSSFREPEQPAVTKVQSR